MIPIIPRQSSEDDRPLGLKFTRNNFFNFSKNDNLKRTPSNSKTTTAATSQLPPIMSIKREEPNVPSRTPSYSSSISSPTIPTRSPFRLRDSQVSTTMGTGNASNNKVTASHENKSSSSIDDQPTIYSSISSSSSSSVTTIEDDLAHELENIWKLKSNKHNPQLVTKEKVDMNSEDMLLQLLISHAVIEAKDYQVLSFEDYELLKQHQIRLTNKIKNSETKLDVDKKIQETSHSLSNLSTNKNRESVLLLLDEAIEADRKVKILTQRLNELKSEQVETQYQILQHTAGVLCLGLQKLEVERQYIPTPSSSVVTSPTDTSKFEHLQAEIESIKNTLETMLKKYVDVPPSASITQLLDQLESQINVYKSDRNQLQSKLNAVEERYRIESMSEKKLEIQLRATQGKKEAAENKILSLQQEIDNMMKGGQSDHNTALESQLSIAQSNHDSVQKELEQEQLEVERLKSAVSNMELTSNQIQSKATVLEQRVKGLQQEMEHYRDEVVHLRSEKERLELTLKRKTITQVLNDGLSSLETKYEQQLEEQEQEYQAQLKEQAAFLDKTARQYEQLKQEQENVAATCRDLEMLIREKQKALDARDVQISRLEAQLRAAAAAPPQLKMDRTALEKLQVAFSEKEAAWIESSTAMEANFEGILKEFDRLTGTAMEFEADKQKYERRIEQLTQEVRMLESSLNAEKQKNLGQANDTPTTASLRKEFRKMITDMKADHQRTLDREIEEKKRLEKQLKDLKHEREMSRYERTNKGVQTLFNPSL